MNFASTCISTEHSYILRKGHLNKPCTHMGFLFFCIVTKIHTRQDIWVLYAHYQFLCKHIQVYVVCKQLGVSGFICASCLSPHRTNRYLGKPNASAYSTCTRKMHICTYLDLLQ